jgi:hypothetical protein
MADRAAVAVIVEVRAAAGSKSAVLESPSRRKRGSQWTPNPAPLLATVFVTPAVLTDRRF